MTVVFYVGDSTAASVLPSAEHWVEAAFAREANAFDEVELDFVLPEVGVRRVPVTVHIVGTRLLPQHSPLSPQELNELLTQPAE